MNMPVDCGLAGPADEAAAGLDVEPAFQPVVVLDHEPAGQSVDEPGQPVAGHVDQLVELVAELHEPALLAASLHQWCSLSPKLSSSSLQACQV